MTNRLARVALAFICSLGLFRAASAQDVVITNARIIVGNGTVVDQGTIVVRGGRIVSAAAGRAAAPAGAKTIDGRGLTAVAG